MFLLETYLQNSLSFLGATGITCECAKMSCVKIQAIVGEWSCSSVEIISINKMHRQNAIKTILANNRKLNEDRHGDKQFVVKATGAQVEMACWATEVDNKPVRLKERKAYR